jgi:hypothetical protein
MISQKLWKEHNPISIFIKTEIIEFDDFFVISNKLKDLVFKEIKEEHEILLERQLKEKLKFYKRLKKSKIPELKYLKESTDDELLGISCDDTWFLNWFLGKYISIREIKEEKEEFISVNGIEECNMNMNDTREEKQETVKEKYSEIKKMKDSLLLSEDDYNFIFKNWSKYLGVNFFNRENKDRITEKEYAKLLNSEFKYKKKLSENKEETWGIRSDYFPVIPFEILEKNLLFRKKLFVGDEKNFEIYKKNEEDFCDCCKCYDYENGVSLLNPEKYEGKIVNTYSITIPLYYYKNMEDPRTVFLLGLLN